MNTLFRKCGGGGECNGTACSGSQVGLSPSLCPLPKVQGLCLGRRIIAAAADATAGHTKRVNFLTGTAKVMLANSSFYARFNERPARYAPLPRMAHTSMFKLLLPSFRLRLPSRPYVFLASIATVSMHQWYRNLHGGCPNQCNEHPFCFLLYAAVLCPPLQSPGQRDWELGTKTLENWIT